MARKSIISVFSLNGGGGGGTTDYNDLDNKPKINNTELSGNKSSSDLGIFDVASGNTIPSGEKVGQLFLLLQDVGEVKKGLYRYNGSTWDNIKLGSDEPETHLFLFTYTNGETSLEKTIKGD